MKYLVLILALSLTLAGCRKNTITPAGSTKLDLLASTKSKTWIGSAGNVKVAELSIDLDLYKVLPLCLTDDIMVIYQAKTVENKEGNTACDSGASTDVKNRSNWKFNADETSIIVDNFTVNISPTEKLSFANQELKIKELSTTTLKLEAKIQYRGKDAVVLSSFIAK